VNLAEDKEVGRRRVVVGLVLVNGDGGEFVVGTDDREAGGVQDGLGLYSS